MKKQTWVQEYTIAEDGFCGNLFRPEKDVFPGKATLVLGGGGMPYSSTLAIAEAFAGIGITSLALGYYGVKDAPKLLIRVPIEYVEKATDRLHEMGAGTVVATGISKGAELALVAASLLPQINSVIAFSPSGRVNMGIGSGISWVNASSWTFRGQELPFAYAPASGVKALWNTLCKRELTFRPVYERAYRAAGPESLIAVEKINGSVLLAASVHDSLWPSAEDCKEMADRLDAAGFPHPHKELIFRYASHLLLPFETAYDGLFRVGRKYPKKCKRTTHRLQAEVLAWLKAC